MEKCIIENCRKKTVSDVFEKCNVHHTEEVKEELKEELKDVKTIYVVGINYNLNNWNHFKLYYMGKDHKGEPTLIKIWLKKADMSCWNKPKPDWKGGYFESNVWGMDRTFEIVYNLGIWLFNDGYKFKQEFLNSQ